MSAAAGPSRGGSAGTYYDSPEYLGARSARKGLADFDMLSVECL